MEIQKRREPPIGVIALQENLLSVSQAFNILNKQIGTTKMFGEIAVALGYMNEEEAANE